MPDIKLVKDPVCGMEMEPHTAPVSEQYNREPYYFCGRDCRDSFNADPDRYLKKEEDEAA